MQNFSNLVQGKHFSIGRLNGGGGKNVRFQRFFFNGKLAIS